MKATFSALVALPTILSIVVNADGENINSCRTKKQTCFTQSAPKDGRSPLCATYGKVKSQDIMSSCKASSFDECRDTCLDDKSCKAFGFSNDDSTCSLVGDWLKHSVLRADDYDYGTMYFSRHCYTRTCAKACAAGSERFQLVRNPSFEHDSNSFANWVALSTGKFQPKAGRHFAPDGRKVAYWASVKDDNEGASARFTQVLTRKSDKPEPFYFSAWVGEYGYGSYEPGSVSVKVDGSEVISQQSICTGAPYCQTFGTDAMYQQISGVGLMEGKHPLLEIRFTPTTSNAERQVVYLDAVNLVGMNCSSS